MKKHGQGTHCTKMGANSLAENENIPNAPEFICSICLPKSKSSGFQWNNFRFYISRYYKYFE